MSRWRTWWHMTLWAGIAALVGCTGPYEWDLTGQWSGQFGEQTVELMLGLDHDFSMRQGRSGIEGRWATHAPLHADWLDLWYRTPDGRQGLIPLLAELVDEDHLRLRAGTQLKYRPTHFAAQDGPDQSTLARVD